MLLFFNIQIEINIKNSRLNLILKDYIYIIGSGGLEVACWPLVPKFAGSNPAEKILSTPSFGREVKP
jgi:hypothetical protein